MTAMSRLLVAATVVTVHTKSVTTHQHHATHVSTEAIVLAAIAALAVLACAAWAFARARAYEPQWMVSLSHSMAEAGFRVSATWAEFWDWARLGR
jgi:hypothetical protein